MIGRIQREKPAVATEERASELLKELAQVRAALAAAEARSEERRLALESRDQEVGLMRIQLRVRDARIAALDKEASDLGGLARRNEQISEVKNESAFLTQMRAALAESEARSEERRLALESCTQEVGLMRIQLRVRDARLAALEKHGSGLGGAFAPRNEQTGGAKNDSAALLNDTIAALSATVAERDASVAALKAGQLADGETLAALRNDFARALADAEVQRKNLATLEAALVAANTRLAEEQAATLAALEQRASMEAAISEQQQRVARLEVELAAVVRDRDARVAAAAAVQTEHFEQRANLAAASARVLELEAEARAQVHATTALQKQACARLDEPAQAHDNARGTGGTREKSPEPVEPLFIRTDEAEFVHVLGRKTTIGRTPENDVRIDAQYISRHHAVIISGPRHTIIEDLNSTNGVTVNGRRVRRQTLTDGDVVLIGNVPFRFAAPRELATLKARA